VLEASDVEAVLSRDEDVVVARAVDGGTNGLLLRSPIRPAFGLRSALTHAARARAACLSACVVDIAGFAADIDTPAALTAYLGTRP
jgi:2-phospho-L-lactate guanylyltransferase (CobY/MobA/RfbA family)